MAGNTRGQSLRDQSNPPDNTAFSALSTQMTQFATQMNTQMTQLTASMNAMRTDLNTVNAEMEALKATSRSPTPQPKETTTQQPTAPQTTPPEADKRWRPEEVGYYDGTGDMFAFIDRLRSTAS